MGRYAGVILLQYIFGTGAIGVLIYFGFGEIISYLLLLPVAVLLSYGLQKLWVFQ